MTQNRAASFLQLIRKAQHGRLKIYLGYGPGVGKTYQMLQEGHRLKADGIDVVVGLVETHGRPETAKLIEGLEVIPRRRVEYHGITIEEMDVDAILARKPQVVLVDELAHTNAPDSRNAKRYQDVQELLAAGIHVISTLNVQHMESLYDTVEKLLGVKVRERIPDSVVAEADVVVNVDLAAEDLQRRLEEGKVYPKDRAATALQNFFTQSNLEHLRELTFREVASQLDLRRRSANADSGKSSGGNDQVMVCLSSGGPNSAQLLRYGSRLAGRLNRNWYAVYVQTPREEPTVIDARIQRLLADNLTLANQLGATVFTFKGQDIADTILRFAREYRVGNIIIGRPRKRGLWDRLAGKRSVAEELIHRSEGVTVIVVDAQTGPATAAEMPPDSIPAPVATETEPAKLGPVGSVLSPERVVIWNDPVSRETVFEQLAACVSEPDTPSTTEILTRLNERERAGSTFLNEGVALPHARIPGLAKPMIAIGLTHEGVLDSPSENPIDVVFMLLTPVEGSTHLQLLARAGRLLQNLDLRRRLAKAQTPQEVVGEIRQWEQSTMAPART